MNNKKRLFKERMARVRIAKGRKITGKQARLNLWILMHGEIHGEIESGGNFSYEDFLVTKYGLRLSGLI